jgi:hypothetical protein
MEGFVKDHVDDHPEVAGYVAALTTRLDLLTDAGATAVLQTTVPAYLFNHWGREKEFAPARESLRMYTAPTRGEERPFDVINGPASPRPPSYWRAVRTSSAVRDGPHSCTSACPQPS